MKEKIGYIHIQNPCTQAWNSMEDSDNGKFCRSCNKEVINFYRI